VAEWGKKDNIWRKGGKREKKARRKKGEKTSEGSVTAIPRVGHATEYA